MGVRGGIGPGGDKGIGSLDGELRAAEAEHVLSGGRLREQRASGKCVPKHGETIRLGVKRKRIRRGGVSWRVIVQIYSAG